MAQQFDIVGNLLLKVDGAEAGLNKLKNSLSKLEMPKGLESSFKKSFSSLDDIFARYRKQLEKGFDTKGDVSNITKIGKELDSELTKVSNHLTKLTGEKVDLKVDTEKVRVAKKDLEDILEKKRQLGQEALNIKIETSKGGIDNVKQLLEEFQRVVGDTKAGNAIGKALSSLDTGDLQKTLGFLKEAETNLTRIGEKKRLAFQDTGFTFEGALKHIIDELTKTEGKFGEVINKEQLFKEALSAASAGQLDQVNKILEKMVPNFDKNAASAREAAKAAEDYAKSTLSMKDQVKQLQQSTQYFFSLRNMINLFKRGIREAVQTVKDLDKAMTETAVVTKYSVGDMWAKLPEYTANANALGATVQDMYESTTLYYQQGLNTQQAMSIATETMKMARIAGLEAAEATDMMTAALRGFNMEINETSAQRINDVYSQLAAKTASNTEELGTAMQRTASIAHSAGMSFEGTAAFLAQAIETTREPAENLGTAMKTIVARFQELKKNPLEIADVDGEEVSYNKVDTALKTIGVDLKDTNGQFRDLDKVFLDISQRWDGLTQTQQRYIATTAAGSRQQSRFIAMMSNYDRTMELMGYANNSAGASTVQFNKTLESLEAKINKFQNAWKEFLMGIMNDSWTKKFVDTGTTILGIVNKLIDALSFGGKAKGVKSFLSIFTAFTALKMAGRGVNALIGGLGGLVDPQSSMGAGFRQGAIGAKQAANAQQAAMIYQPIVAELRAIRQLQGQQLTKENQTRIGAYDQYNKFKDSRAFLTGVTKGGKAYSLQDIQQSLTGLDARSQNLLMQGNTGTAYNMTNAILSQYYKQLGGNKKAIGSIKNAERYLNAQRQTGQLTWEEYFKHISNPALMRAALDKSKAGADVADIMLKGIADEAIKADSTQYLSREAGKLYAEYAKAGKDIASSNIQKEIAEKAQEAAIAQATKAYADKSGQASTKNGKGASILNGIGQLGSAFTQAGMGIQAFGSILTSSANPALQMFGTALNTVGGLISGLGMGISGITQGFTAIAGSSIMTAAETALAGKSLFGLSLTAGTLTGILGILVVAIAGAAFLIKKHNENIKKAAEEVTETYKEKSSTNQSNISNLKQWRSELAVLSKGVDENGYNVSLDTNDYDRYLEIVDEIAKINPAIVEGYNAQGHAIINNNRALEETLALEQQREKEILKNYTSDESLSKLLKARNLEGNYVAGGRGVETIEFELKPRTNMRREMAKIGLELQRNKDKIDLSGLDIDIDALARGNEAEFQKVLNNYDVFKRLVSNAIDSAGNEWSDRSQEAIEKAFTSFDESDAELDELVQPVYEALSARASQTAGFKQMENGLKAPFQQALKELATTGDFGDDGKAIGEAAKAMATKFASYNDIYLEAMEQVADANEQFALDLSEEEYEVNTEDAIASLESLKATLEDTPEGHAIAEWINNEIAKIKNHVSGGAKTIEEAWDTIADKVATAEGALEDFNKKTEKDFSTAAEGMKGIFDSVMDEDAYHTIGFGDNTFWQGAEKLLGRDRIMNKTAEEVRGMMKNIEPFLKEGPEGVQNFANKVAGLKDKLEDIKGVDMTEDGWFKSIDENVNPEAWTEIADILGISEELLTSMINKARQFRLMDFTDMSAVREAYAASDSVIHGTQTVKITRQNEEGKTETIEANKLYITDAELQSQMGSDYYQEALRNNKIEDLKAQGIEVLPEHLKDLDASIMKNQIGINNMTDAIETFGATGVFDKSEIYDAAKTLAEEQAGDKFDQDAFDKEFNDEWATYLENMEYPTLEPVQSIEGYVASIADSLANQEVAEGRLSKTRSDELNKAINGKEGTDTLGEYFAQGFDVMGEKLTKYTYEKGLGELQSLYTGGQAYLTSLEEGRNKAANTAEKAAYDAEIARTTEYLASLNSQIEAGKTKWEEFNSQETPELEGDLANTGAETGTKPSPYTPEQEAYYSRNAAKEWWTNFWHSADETKPTPSTDETYSHKDGGEGYTSAPTNEDVSSYTSTMTDAVTTASTTLDTSGQELANVATQLGDSATQLSIAASNLTTVAAVIVSNSSSQSSNSSGTIPGVPQTAQPNQSSVSGAIVIDNSAALSSLDEVYQKATETAGKINEGATFAIRTPGLQNLTKAASAAQKVSDSAGSKNISLNTSVSGASSNSINTLKESVQKFNGLKNHQVTLTTNLKGASASNIETIIAAINSFHLKTDHTVTLKTIKETVEKDATGTHNHGYASPPSFGSAARGSYGQVGPKGKGGLTLTGELGYEIAWLPSENRSMILGANGPQMVNLPGDAVVWTHEQSKKILKQKSIPAGSQGNGTIVHTTGGWDFSGSSGGIYTGGSGAASQSVTSAAKTVSKTATQTAAKVGKVSVWWENIARKTESTQRKADTAYSRFEKYIKNMEATLKTTGTKGQGNKYIANMTKVLGYNQAQYKKADKELKRLDKSNKKTTVKYKSGKKEKSAKIKLGKYIKYDSESGTYIIDQTEISKVAKDKKRGKAQAQAIKDAAEKKINEKLSKRNKAEDAISKAKEALDKFGEELYNTFFAWEVELTKIWNITQKIAQAESDISRLKATEELLNKQIATGLATANEAFKTSALDKFSTELQRSMYKIRERQDLIAEQQQVIDRALSLADERTTLNNIQKKLDIKKSELGYLSGTERAGYEEYAEQLQQRITAQASAHKYLSVSRNVDGTLKVDFNTEAFEADKTEGLYTEAAAKAIQDYVKELVDSSEQLNQDYIDLTNDVGEIYDSLSDLQEEWASYANELWDISEAEIKKETDNLKKLSDSVNNALKNLLDDVKRKLDERRKQEDNAKTERDILQKQQRLAALRADTSGGHQVEIAQLEKEIADAQQSYQRTLEDQLLDKLQQQGDLAAEQRERQIQLQEAIAEGVNNAALVDMWMADPETYRDEIYEAFKTSKNYDKAPQILQQNLDREFESMMGGLITNQKKQTMLIDSIGTLDDTLKLLKASIDGLQSITSSKSIGQLRELGLTDEQIRKAGYGLEDFINSGITSAKELKNAGFTVKQLKDAGYLDQDIKEAGYSISEFKTGTETSGIAGANRAAAAGYSGKDIVKEYGAGAAMRSDANVKGSDVQSVTGKSAKYIQTKIINADPNDKAVQKDLAGVQGGTVNIDDKVGKITDSHISANGKKIGANKGSTLYTANWDANTGKPKGKWTAYAFDKLTAKLVEQYPIDAKQAISYALKHSKPGTKLNKNFKDLMVAAGKIGATYSLSNGITGSIGSNGKIYYNQGKDGVQIWDAATGKLTLDKYNLDDFKKKANKANVGREYKQVLKKRGISGYATGGLADYTGPAWLDGTPSKPELVLNAKDTKNFIMLKDVLAKAMNGIGDTSNTYGDILYEININVDKIEKDYDVDRVVDKVKKEIIKGAGYRNVTQVRNFK